MELSRVRTSYERMVAHRCRPPFAYSAEEDGVVTTLSTDPKLMKVTYKSGKIVCINYGDEYTKNGGGGFYCTQNIVVNGFKEGDKFKKGDILVYNEKFFTQDPYSKQVDWNMGVLANVACMEANTTLDDGNAISSSLAKKLEFNPVHVRDVVIKKNTTIHHVANIGDSVLNTDALMIFDQSELGEDIFGKLDEDAMSMLANLNRQTPKAKFTGRIANIEVYFKCPQSELSTGLKKIVNRIVKEKNAKSAIAEGSSNAKEFDKSLQIKYTDRIGITDLDDETVIVRFYIQQDMGMDIGSKIELCTSSKTVTSHIEQDDWEVEDGSINVHALYSCIGFQNRIINSPFVVGMTSRVMEKLEKDVLKLYFGE